MPRKPSHKPRKALADPGIMLGPKQHLSGLIADAIEVQTVPPGTPDEARGALDIPLDSYLFRLTLDFEAIPSAPALWHGKRWELIGTYPLPETSLTRYRFRLPVFADYVGAETAIAVWRRRVYWKEPPGLYVGVRWHPSRGETNEMDWPLHVPPPTAARYLREGLKLLQDLERRGRRWQPPSAAECEEYRQTLVNLIQLARRQGKEPTEMYVAELLAGMDRSADSEARSLRNRLKRYGLGTWPEFVATVDDPL